MAKAATTTATSETATLPPVHTTIKVKKPVDWLKLVAKAEGEHWRKIKMVIDFREQLHAGKPKSLDAEKAAIAAHGLEDVVEAQALPRTEAEMAELVEEVKDQGLCEFYRREGKPGIWFPTNQLKAHLKENWTALGYAKSIRGSRSRLAELVFAYGCDYDDREWIYLGEGPDGVKTSVSHTKGPKGPVTSIKRNEFLTKPRMEFMIYMTKRASEELPDEALAAVINHGQVLGIGANRSQQTGTYNLVSMDEVE